MMGEFVVYSIKVSLCLVMFYVFYKLLLSRTTLHTFNRFVILALVMASLVLPFVHITISEPVVEGAVTVDQLLMMATVVEQESPELHFSLINIVVLIYIIGVAGFFIRMLLSYFGILRIMKQASKVIDDEGMKVYVVDKDVSPFSWFRNIVISATDYRDNYRAIITHEKAHVARGHSADILLCNILTVVQWFNPAAWLLKSELQDVHEYEADEAVLCSGIDVTGYQLLLVRKAVGDRLFAIANNLSKDSLKKRITMMKMKKTNRWASMKALVMLPLTAIAVVAFASPEMAEVENNVVADTEQLVGIVKESVVEPVADLPRQVTAVADVAEKTKDDTVKVVAVGQVKKTNDEKVFDVVEEMPSFPGGTLAMMSFLANNLKYPKESVDKNEQGRVIVSFNVLQDGSISNACILRSISPQLDAEALRVVNSMPKWEPGKQGGKPVNVKYTVPVVFRLQGNENKKTEDKNLVAVRTGAGAEPLVVINGKEMTNMKSLESINPNDIESITVLKDANAISQYGEKGKDGVILIEMKTK